MNDIKKINNKEFSLRDRIEWIEELYSILNHNTLRMKKMMEIKIQKKFCLYCRKITTTENRYCSEICRLIIYNNLKTFFPFIPFNKIFLMPIDIIENQNDVLNIITVLNNNLMNNEFIIKNSITLIQTGFENIKLKGSWIDNTGYKSIETNIILKQDETICSYCFYHFEKEEDKKEKLYFDSFLFYFCCKICFLSFISNYYKYLNIKMESNLRLPPFTFFTQKDFQNIKSDEILYKGITDIKKLSSINALKNYEEFDILKLEFYV